MAKFASAPKSDDVEVQVTLMRRVAPERFEVVVGTVKGPVVVTKTLEKAVSLMVGRGTARTSLRKQHDAAAAKLGLAVES